MVGQRRLGQDMGRLLDPRRVRDICGSRLPGEREGLRRGAEAHGLVEAQRRQAIAAHVRVKSTGDTGFHVPLEVAWKEGSTAKKMRIALAPGSNRAEISCSAQPVEVSVPGLERVLGKHSVVVD